MPTHPLVARHAFSWILFLTLLVSSAVGCTGHAATPRMPPSEPTSEDGDDSTADALAGDGSDAMHAEQARRREDAPTETQPEALVDAAPRSLAESLNHAGVTIIAQFDAPVRDPNGDEVQVQALVYVDAQGTHTCVAEGRDQPLCWRLPVQARYVLPLRVDYSDVLEVTTSVGQEPGAYVGLRIEDGDLTAIRGESGSPGVPLEGVTTEPPTPLFAALRGHDLATSRFVVVARTGTSMRVCRRPADGVFTCTEPTQLDALAVDRFELNSVETDYDGVVSVKYWWSEQMGDVFSMGQGILFLRSNATDVTLLATVHTAYEERSRVSTDNDDIEVAVMEMYDVELRRATCVVVGAPTYRRRLLHPNGTSRALRPVARRAPNEISATGIHPLAFNMAGAWELRSEGGLRRIGVCDYDDDDNFF